VTNTAEMFGGRHTETANEKSLAAPHPPH